MTKFYESWRERTPKEEPLTVEEILNWWEDPAFDMPDWYHDEWEPSN